MRSRNWRQLAQLEQAQAAQRLQAAPGALALQPLSVPEAQQVWQLLAPVPLAQARLP